MAVAAYHAADVAPAVVVVDDGRRDASPRAQELAIQREMRPLTPARSHADHVLPPAARQEPVIPACDQLGAVLERNREGRLDAGPLVQHARHHKASIGAVTNGPADLRPDLD